MVDRALKGKEDEAEQEEADNNLGRRKKVQNIEEEK